MKAAGLIGERAYYAGKVNANLPGNPSRNRLPTVQGSGRALRCDQRDAPRADGLDGDHHASHGGGDRRRGKVSGAHGYIHSRHPGQWHPGTQPPSCALSRAAIERVYAWDGAPGVAKLYAQEMGAELGCDVVPTDDYRGVLGQCDIIVTCTASRSPLLDADDLAPGTFVAGVGADSESKHSIRFS